MNVIFPSNTVVAGRKNYTNNFAVKFDQPFNCLKNDVFIEVTNVLYPHTIKNIPNDDDVYFSLSLKFKNFSNIVNKNRVNIAQKKNSFYGFIYNGNDNEFLYETGKIKIKNGIYNMKQILTIINNRLEEFNVNFFKTENGKISVTWEYFYEIWIKQMRSLRLDFSIIWNKVAKQMLFPTGEVINEFNDKISFDGGLNDSFHLFELTKMSDHDLAYVFERINKNANTDDTDNYVNDFFPEVDLSIEFSDSLKYMLGMEDNITMSAVINKKNFNHYLLHQAKFLPDIKGGVNNMFIYCDQLEPILVGSTQAELLAVVPIEKEQGDGEITSFQPVSSKKKFKKSYISDIHFSIKDSAGVTIPFDFGTVNIETIIYNA